MAMKSLANILLVSVVLQTQQAVTSQAAVDTSQLVAANNAFAVELYGYLAQQPGNFICSPFSVDTTLLMTYGGARGNTARQMANALHLPNTKDDAYLRFAVFLDRLSATNAASTQFLVANSIWVQRGYPFLNPFQEQLHDIYKADLKQIDLTGWPAEFNPIIAATARKQVNDWAAKHTGGRISAVLPVNLPAQNTRLILLNAVYFKGLWATHFDTGLTANSIFRIEPGESVSVPTMHVHGNFPYYSDEELQVVQLPYISNSLSMFILLPRESNGLSNLEKSLAVSHSDRVPLGGSKEESITVSQLEQWCQFCSVGPVNVSLPKFTETSEFDLQDALKMMGIVDAFDEVKSDFSGITTKKPFFIQAAIHKVYLNVDEQGTEAAAATSLNFSDADPSRPPLAFTVDHPFLYLIRDNASGAILFMGRVSDPTKE